MTSSTRWTAFTLALLAGIVGPAGGLCAQEGGWRVSAAASQAWFGGGVADTTGAGLTFGPTPSVVWGLVVDHAVGGVHLGVGFSYLSASLQISGSGVRIVSEDTHLGQFRVAALANIMLLRIGSSGSGFSLAAGPTLDLWSATDADSRTRAGVLGALLFSAPIAPRWTLQASAAGSLSGSPFNAGELPVEFQTSTLRSGQIGIGLRYGS